VDDVEILPGLVLPESDFGFRTSRSSGPGGQNVNKVESRVTLLFDLAGCAVLDEEQKARLRERLSGRISRQGVLRVTSQRHRSQAANRQAAVERFVELMQQALSEDPPRTRRHPPRRAKRRRLREKRRRGELKRLRSTPKLED
jgi:ribosome-associated protein